LVKGLPGGVGLINMQVHGQKTCFNPPGS